MSRQQDIKDSLALLQRFNEFVKLCIQDGMTDDLTPDELLSTCMESFQDQLQLEQEAISVYEEGVA